MDSFLLKTVKSIFREELNLGNIVFVLPNQRAGVYLKKHITAQLQQTNLFPEIITFDNFVEKITSLSKVPALELLINFYQVYKETTPKDDWESFELFSNWATTVLDDFNEIDAYLVDPKAIFSSLQEINELHNWNPNTELTKNYLSFLRNLKKYYYVFTQKLVKEGIAYQGLIFRQAVDSILSYIENTNNYFVFAGFNHLKASESQIVQEFLAAEKGRIYWDISENLLVNQHPAGQFVRKYQSDWNHYKNNSFNWVSTRKIIANNVKIIGVPKNVGMLKYAGELLEQSNNVDETALILADQSVLPIALNSLSEKIEKANITMGFPLKNFPFSDLIDCVFQLYTSKNSQNNKPYYHKQVLRLLQHPIIQSHFDHTDDLVKLLIKRNAVYYSFSDIKASCDIIGMVDFDVVLQLFKPVLEDFFYDISGRVKLIIQYLKTKLQGIEKEVLYRHFQLNQQMLLLYEKHEKLINLPKGLEGIKSLYKIYNKLLFSESFNFIGEPLQGLQIMGFLETQALQFKHIILTSLNEGILPKGKRTNSFIPFDVRKHFGLLTYKEEDAIASYHFFRLVESADKVSLLYNNQADTFGGGEKSQFLTQLLWRYPDIQQAAVNSDTSHKNIELQQLKKTPAVIDKLTKLAKKGFSPSALATYLYNPIAFYQQRVLDIENLDIIEETLADNTMGTVIHKTLEALYQPLIGTYLSEEVLQNLLPKIPEQVKIEFKEANKSGQFKSGKNKLIYEVIISFVKRFIKQEIRDIKNAKTTKIIALESTLETEIQFPEFDFPIKIRGIIDRIDEVDGVVRILDFKSGKVVDSQLRMDDFSKAISDYNYSKALQILLYAYLYSKSKDYDVSKELQAGIISFKNLNAGFIPVNFGTGRAKDYQITPSHLQSFLDSLEILLLEIFDPEIPFLERE